MTTTIEALVAREEIRELVASYTYLGDGGRIDKMVELFETDAVRDDGVWRFSKRTIRRDVPS